MDKAKSLSFGHNFYQVMAEIRLFCPQNEKLTHKLEKRRREKYIYPPQTTTQLSMYPQITNCVNCPSQTTKKMSMSPLITTKSQK
jgi:hypothetical protein